MTVIIGLRFAECLLCIKLHVDKHFAWIALLESSQLQRGDDYYPHFTDEETKAQRGQVTSPELHSQEVADSGSQPRLL